jgi:uncharacterized integral membrane protein
MNRTLLTVVLLAAALLAVFVSALNSSLIEIELAFARFASPLGVALVIAFAAGLLAGLGWQIKWVAQLLAERGRLRRALRIAESKARQHASSK